MIQLDEMSFLIIDLCYYMKRNGLDYDEEFELELDEELKDDYKDNEITEQEDIDYIVNIVKLI